MEYSFGVFAEDFSVEKEVSNVFGRWKTKKYLGEFKLQK